MKFLRNEQKNNEKYSFMEKNNCIFVKNQCFMNSFLPEEDEEDVLMNTFFEKNTIEENLDNLVKNSHFLTIFEISNKNQKNQIISFSPEKMFIKDL